jgi:hypothetical protein
MFTVTGKKANRTQRWSGRYSHTASNASTSSATSSSTTFISPLQPFQSKSLWNPTRHLRSLAAGAGAGAGADKNSQNQIAPSFSATAINFPEKRASQKNTRRTRPQRSASGQSHRRRRAVTQLGRTRHGPVPAAVVEAAAANSTFSVANVVQSRRSATSHVFSRRKTAPSSVPSNTHAKTEHTYRHTFPDMYCGSTGSATSTSLGRAILPVETVPLSQFRSDSFQGNKSTQNVSAQHKLYEKSLSSSQSIKIADNDDQDQRDDQSDDESFSSLSSVASCSSSNASSRERFASLRPSTAPSSKLRKEEVKKQAARTEEHEFSFPWEAFEPPVIQPYPESETSHEATKSEPKHKRTTTTQQLQSEKKPKSAKPKSAAARTKTKARVSRQRVRTGKKPAARSKINAKSRPKSKTGTRVSRRAGGSKSAALVRKSAKQSTDKAPRTSTAKRLPRRKVRTSMLHMSRLQSAPSNGRQSSFFSSNVPRIVDLHRVAPLGHSASQPCLKPHQTQKKKKKSKTPAKLLVPKASLPTAPTPPPEPIRNSARRTEPSSPPFDIFAHHPDRVVFHCLDANPKLAAVCGVSTGQIAFAMKILDQPGMVTPSTSWQLISTHILDDSDEFIGVPSRMRNEIMQDYQNWTHSFDGTESTCMFDSAYRHVRNCVCTAISKNPHIVMEAIRRSQQRCKSSAW